MIIINTASVTLFPSNNPAISSLNRDTSPKSLNLFARFRSKDDNFVTPKGIPAKVAATIPKKIEPFTFLAFKTLITIRPNKATSAPQISSVFCPFLHCAKSTILTSVDGLLTTIPAFFSPMIVIKSPIPGVIAILIGSGMARMIAWRRPTTVITINNTPDKNTMVSVWL